MKRGRRRTLGNDTVKLNTADVREAVAIANGDAAALVVLQGSEAVIGTHVTLEHDVVIGRDPDVGLALEDDGISRRHCLIRREGDHDVLEDLGSTNGTQLNGRSLKEPSKLQAGDRIFVGNCVVKFTAADAVEVRYHAQMDHLVGKDDLTGLYAKRRFDAALTRAVDNARVARQCLSLFMLDLDELKQINDQHGHPVGAYTISEVGRIVGKKMPLGGAACRFGGDEFAAYVPNLDKPAATTLAEEIRTAVVAHRFEKDGVVVRPTVSIGVATLPDDARTADTLMRRADQALYRAKRGGRNLVVS